jgi:hypothetical protein
MTNPDLPEDELLDAANALGGQLVSGVLDIARAAVKSGCAQGIEFSANYADAMIREAGIIGDAAAILIILRDNLRLAALRLTTEDPPDAECPPSNDL